MSQSLPSSKTALPVIVLCVTIAPLVGATAGPRGAEVGWRTGTGLPTQLRASVDFVWRKVPLRDGLMGLGQSQRVAIFLDRRVDPGQTVDFSVRGAPLQDALRQLASELKLGVGDAGPVIYFGPDHVASKLQALIDERRQQLAEFPPTIRNRLLQRRAWQWPMLAEPRELLRQLAAEVDCPIEGLDRVPHDLWPEMELPAMTFGERLSLVAAGFDMSFEFVDGGRAARLVPIPERIVLRRAYPASSWTEDVLPQVSQRFPAARITYRGQTVVVEGAPELHTLIRAHLTARSRSSQTDAIDRKRFTLRLANRSAQSLLQRVAQDLSLTIKADPGTARRLSDLISVEVTDATLDQLLTAALQPLGLTHEIRDRVLFVKMVDP